MGSKSSRESPIKKDGCCDVTWRTTKSFFRALKSTVGLIFLLVLYTGLGGYMFHKLESPEEDLEAVNMNKTREKFLDDMLDASTKANWSEEGQVLLDKFEEEMYEFFLRGRLPEKQQTWTMLGGVIYCITVYTTIGYGHIAPTTYYGRVATVLYAIIGIPLCLMVLADLGRLLTRLIKALLTIIRLYYYRGHLKRLRRTKAVQAIEKTLDMKDDVDTKELSTEVGEEFNFPVPLAIGLLLVYLLGCAGFYHYHEDWTYAESVYFLFISVSTIGFGDMVPRADDQVWFLISTIVVFIGLSLVSMIITVLIDFISNLVNEAKQKVAETVNQMGEAMGLDLNLGDSKSDDGSEAGSETSKKEHKKAPRAESEDLSTPTTSKGLEI